MENRKTLLQVLLYMALVLSLIVPASAVGASGAGPRPDDRLVNYSAADSSSVFSAMALNTPQGNVTPMVAAGSKHTVGLNADGTVVAVGRNDYGQCDAGDWTDITQVAAGDYHTVGVKSDGTVVAVGHNGSGQCDIGGWTDIIQVAAGAYDTVGLNADGTVVVVESNYNGECDVGNWTDITQIVSGWMHTVGLKSDGTVAAVGDNSSGQCDVGDWTDIIQVAARANDTVGLKSDGTVVAVGYNYVGQCDVGDWTDVVQVAAGGGHTVGLKFDGTVVAVGYNDDGRCDVDTWTDIVRVATGGEHTVGLKSDGTAVAVGVNDYGQCDVSNWNIVTGVPPVNWLLIGGIIAVVVAAGLVIFFMRRRRTASTRTQKNLVEPERRLVKMGFASKMWGFLRRPTTTFGAVKEDTLSGALKYALICLVIFGALTGIVLAVMEIDKPFLLIAESIGLSIAGGMLFIFIGGSWTHLWVKLLGGRQGCSYRQTLKTLIYGATPIYLVGWVPFLAERAGGPLGVLVSIWALVLIIIGLRELHGITTGRAVGVSILAIVIPTFVILLLAVVGVALLVVLGFFWLFGGG
ncbi:MAG: YIP1 family protein [Dehalococcoidia bacterium]